MSPRTVVGIALVVGNLVGFPVRAQDSPAPLYELLSSVEHELFGISVAGAGDFNGDGFDDLLIGASNFDAVVDGDVISNVGRAYLYSGRTGTLIRTFMGEAENDIFGRIVSGGCDVNNDGLGDTVVGAPLFGGPSVGRVYVFYGSTLPGVLDVPAADANRIFTGQEVFGSFGNWVSCGGDVDRDGHDDVIVGADSTGTGRVFVFSGSSGQVIRTFNGEASNDGFGFPVSDAGDVNGDGFADVIVGAFSNSAGGDDAGRAYVFSGQTGNLLSVFTGVVEGATFGRGVAGVGDVDGDGLDDVIVGGSGNAGVALFYGNEDFAGGEILATDADVIISGLVGHPVSAAGDMNADGFADFMVGTSTTRVFLGGGLPETLDAAEAGLVFSAETLPDQGFGDAIARAGDVNGDGADDIIIGDPDVPVPGEREPPGRVLIFPGTGMVFDPACSAPTDCNGEFLTEFEELDLVVINEDEIDALATASVGRTGVVADGVTMLLLRVRTDDPVTFSLQDPNGDPAGSQWGALVDLDGINPSNAHTVIPVSTSQGTFGFAAYRAPIDFPAEAMDSVRDGAKIVISASTRSLSSSASLTLLPPPVVLVHGVWSDSDAWADLEGHLESVGLRVCDVCRLDYGSMQPAGSFDPLAKTEINRFTVETLIGATSAARKAFRLENVAVTQVDVVGHSMGGLVARARVVAPYKPYKRKDNYRQGDFRKLVTVGTPHLGTPIADWFVEHKCDRVAIGPLPLPLTLEDLLAFPFVNKPIGPAIFEFQTSSLAIEHIGATDIPSHTVVGRAPTLSLTEEFLDWLISRTFQPPLVFNTETIDELLGVKGDHDTIVPCDSQKGDNTGVLSIHSGIVHADVVPVDTSETESMDVWDDVERVLLGSIQEVELGTFPAFVRSGVPIQPFACESAQVEASRSQRIQEKRRPDGRRVRPVSGIKATLNPASGTVVRPGERVTVELVIPNGNPVDGAVFFLGGSVDLVEGSPPFATTLEVPTSRAGRIDLRADTFGSGPDNYGASTFLIVQAEAEFTSLVAMPNSLTLDHIGHLTAIQIVGRFDDGSAIDVTHSTAGTSYSMASGGDTATVTPEGLVEALAAGEDIVVATNSGHTIEVPVTVAITNLSPVLQRVADVALAVGTSLDVPLVASDPDDDSIEFSGSNLPAFASITDFGAGTGVLQLQPGDNDEGVFSMIIVATDDGTPPLGDGDSLSVTVTMDENDPPIANAGPDTSVECQEEGQAVVTLDGSASTDPNGDEDIIVFEWFEGSTLVGVGVSVSVVVSLGEHVFTLRVEDADEASSTDDVVITVDDTKPPIVSCSAVLIDAEENDSTSDDESSDESSEDEGSDDPRGTIRFALSFGASDVCGPVIASGVLENVAIADQPHHADESNDDDESADETSACGSVTVSDGDIVDVSCAFPNCGTGSRGPTLMVTAQDGSGNSGACFVDLCTSN